jgi:hypothetical protein
MISIVSLVRRSSVVVSFSLGALYFKERNLKAKAIDLLLFWMVESLIISHSKLKKSVPKLRRFNINI